MPSYHNNPLFWLKLFFYFVLTTFLRSESGDISKPVGSLSITLQPGTRTTPSYTVASAGLNGRVAFRGQVKNVILNEVFFNRVPDLLDPTILSWPFKDDIFSSVKARALAVLDSNQSLLRIDLIDGGSGYTKVPDVYISLPSEGNMSLVNHEVAVATASISSGAVSSINLDANYRGKGYQTVPDVIIEGGLIFYDVLKRAVQVLESFFELFRILEIRLHLIIR